STAMSKPVQTRNLLTEDNMRLVTDNVMGGVSRGEVKWSDQDEVQCLSLTGDVSTENNGGFIQAAMDIDSNDAESLTIEDGVILKVRGNGERYNVHLRTSNLWFPWQAYRATFETDENWQTITIAFKNFIPYKTSSQLKPEKIKRIGIVAIGRDFKADVCISELKFYKAKPDKE
ncbi:MAG: CIA30 family protein, partial [Gammaproteobacteria bacterium]